MENTLPLALEISLSNEERSQVPMSLWVKQLSEQWLFELDNRFEMIVSVKAADYYYSNPVRINLEPKEAELHDNHLENNRNRFL